MTQYLIDEDKLEQIVNLVIRSAKDAWHWEEGIDMPVLNLKLERLLKENEVSELKDRLNFDEPASWEKIDIL